MQIANPCLLVINTQVDFCSPNGFASKLGRDISPITKMLAKLKPFLRYLRTLSVPIIYCQYVARKDLSPKNVRINKNREEKARMCLLNSRGSQFYNLLPLSNEPIVRHSYYDVFSRTDLNKELKKRQIKTLIITGVRSELSIDSTAKRGVAQGYEVMVLKDLIATYKENRAAEVQFLKIFNRYYGYVEDSRKFLSYLE